MALKITIAYIIIGCTWVLVGDTILEFLMGKREFSSEQVFIYNTVKGLLYILITGLALYFFTNQAIRTTSGLEKQYRTLFEDNPNPMWVYDVATFKILAANKAAIEIYGYEKDEFLTLTLEDLRLPEDIPVLKEHIKKVQAGYINSGIFRHKKKNGELFYVNIFSNSTIFDKHKARLIMALDVTDKKLAEEKNIILNKSLIKYQERLEDVLNNITDGFVTLDKELRFTFMNKVSKVITGIEKDEYLGKNIFEVYPQLTKTLFFEKIHEALGGNSVSFEEQFFAGGRWFHFSIYPNPEGVAIYVSDTTETHKMQEEVKRTQTNLNALINNTPDFIWSVDTEFRVQTINAPYRMFIKSFLGTDIQEGDL
ncbi:MAG TPA: PAS domain S-box protein, partial [Bacteroidia bacterium]|nr:PAS domain S-box protein [Bacteroidia bacterium]